MSSPGRILMEMVETARGFALLTPRMFFFAAASGRRMTSSWSCPHELCPLRSSTPMTRKGMLRMRMICPRGSASAKRFSTVVWPSSATFVAPSTSSPPIGRPATTDQSRASKYSAVTPCTTVAQFELPYTTCSVPRTDGAAAWTVCTSRWIAHASSSEIVGRLPWPSRMPLDDLRPTRRPRLGGVARRGDGLVTEQSSVAKREHAARVGGDVRLVGHQDDRHSRPVQLLEERQDLDAGLCVQVPGGLVGEDHG